MRIHLEEAVRIAEHGLAQCLEPLDVPGLDIGLVRIDVDGEVEVVAHELVCFVADLQNVQALQDQDVRLAHGDRITFDDVVDHVAVDGSTHFRCPAL